MHRARPAPGPPPTPRARRCGERPTDGRGHRPGNLQAWAREVRYEAAAALAEPSGAAIATGHTASDQVETILYRLAASPGRRALLGMAVADGRLIRPLLGVTREQTRRLLQRARPGLARGRQQRRRALRARARATWRSCRRCARCIRRPRPTCCARRCCCARRPSCWTALVDDELAGARADRDRAAGRAAARRSRGWSSCGLAEDAAGAYVPQAGERVQELLALGARGGRAELHVGGSAGAVIDDGVLSMRRLPPRETSERRGAPPDED